MKKLLLVISLGCAMVFARPAVGQQTNTADPQLHQRLVALVEKHAQAMNQNDAAAAAALFTEDAVYVTDKGPVDGRQAIEKWYADLFRNVRFSNHLVTVDPDSPHLIGEDGKRMWATGGWSSTIQGQSFGPSQIKGYWSVIREGDDWKIRMLTSNIAPAPPAEAK